jgi:UDP-glucose 4-epimerase
MRRTLGPVVVTGASGFVGRRLVEALQRKEYETISVDLTSSAAGQDATDILSSRLADSIPHSSQIVHLAAISSDKDCARDPLAAIKINIEGTANLLKAAVSVGSKQVIFASSEWVYGDYRGVTPLTEETEIGLNRLTSLYARSKFFAETLFTDYLATNSQILRFGIVYGARLQGGCALEAVATNCLEGDTVTIGSKKNGRRFIHVDDLVAALLCSLERPMKTGIFNLGGPEMITLENIIKGMSVLLDKQISVTEKSPDDWVQRNVISKRFYEEFEFEPVWSLEDGLKAIIRASRQNSSASE